MDFFKRLLEAFKQIFGTLNPEESKIPLPPKPRPTEPTTPTDTTKPTDIEDNDTNEPPVTTPKGEDKTTTETEVVINDPSPILTAEDASEIPVDTIIVVSPIEVDIKEIESTDREIDVKIPELNEPNIQTVPRHDPKYLWCLDNGHGKLTAGKRSPIFDDGETRLFEYEFNRDIVKRIIKILETRGVEYYEVVPEVDVDNILEERVIRANKKASGSTLPAIFVSVHSNAAPARNINTWASPTIHGIETWHYHNSSSGKRIAQIFQKHLIAKTNWRNRQLKSRPDKQFYVLRKTRMPAILTENGFYNNKKQALELIKDDIRQKIADAHAAAIMEIELNGY